MLTVHVLDLELGLITQSPKRGKHGQQIFTEKLNLMMGDSFVVIATIMKMTSGSILRLRGTPEEHYIVMSFRVGWLSEVVGYCNMADYSSNTIRDLPTVKWRDWTRHERYMAVSFTLFDLKFLVQQSFNLSLRPLRPALAKVNKIYEYYRHYNALVIVLLVERFPRWNFYCLVPLAGKIFQGLENITS